MLSKQSVKITSLSCQEKVTKKAVRTIGIHLEDYFSQALSSFKIPPTPAKRTHIRNKTKRTPRQTSDDSSLNPFGDEEEDQILKDDKACEK
jgi:hypothetical protein